MVSGALEMRHNRPRLLRDHVVYPGNHDAGDEAIDECPDCADDGADNRRAITDVQRRQCFDEGIAPSENRSDADAEHIERPQHADSNAKSEGLTFVHENHPACD